MKKIMSSMLLLVAAITLAACGNKGLTVKFDTQGGNAVAAVDNIAKNTAIFEPDYPTHTNQNLSFDAWYTTKDAKAGTKFNFRNKVNKNITLYANWIDGKIATFDTKTDLEVETQVLGSELVVANPGTPERTGYRFGGWFLGKPGLTWLETEAVKFPYTAKGTERFFAYWEPLNSKAESYSDEETYFSSITSDTSLILNPLTYQWSHETEYIGLMATPLYATEVDWDAAIDAGVADYVADFSKFTAKEFSIEALDYKHILVGATKYPYDSDGDEHLDENGNYDRQAATQVRKTKWTFDLNEALKFEDGTKITAKTFEYTLKQYLSKEQNNFRANSYFKTEEAKNGVPILNAYEYFKGEANWEDVGFKVIDDYTFSLETWEPISQANAVSFGINFQLVHPEKYEASLDASKTNSSYGTPAHPYVSYGPYIMKTWDENQKIVFNKNFDYILKETINYKSQVIEVVDDIHQRMQLFDEGKLSVAGLNKDYYAQYNERPNVYDSWNGYPSNILINLAKRGDGKAHHEIMFDPVFRQALLYGFNRNYYATNVFAPNTPSVFPGPLDLKSYLQDPLYYTESADHLAVLEEFGINPETNGFNATRAKALFDEAYAKLTNPGVVKLELISENDDFSKSLAEYIKNTYEEVFGKDKFELVITYQTLEANRAATKDWNFDLNMNAVGFGNSAGVWWQYQAIAFFGVQIGGSTLGLSQPYDQSKISADNPDGYADYWFEEVEVDLTTTYEYLENIGEDKLAEDELTGTLKLLKWLRADGDKPAGIYKGPLNELGLLLVTEDNPYDGTATEPFSGAMLDTWKIVAEFERVFYNHVPIIPTVTRSSATIYAENVIITWPEYSSAFGWGAARYRYLNTDRDFR